MSIEVCIINPYASAISNEKIELCAKKGALQVIEDFLCVEHLALCLNQMKPSFAEGKDKTKNKRLRQISHKSKGTYGHPRSRSAILILSWYAIQGHGQPFQLLVSHPSHGKLLSSVIAGHPGSWSAIPFYDQPSDHRSSPRGGR